MHSHTEHRVNPCLSSYQAQRSRGRPQGYYKRDRHSEEAGPS